MGPITLLFPPDTPKPSPDIPRSWSPEEEQHSWQQLCHPSTSLCVLEGCSAAEAAPEMHVLALGAHGGYSVTGPAQGAWPLHQHAAG